MANKTPINISPEEVVALAARDNKFFIHFMMPELQFPVPDFHDDIFNRMKEILATSTDVRLGKTEFSADQKTRLCLAIPRSHSKTTLAKLFVAWVFMYTDIGFVVYVNKTTDAAIKSVNDIIHYLLSENAQKIFGPVDFVVNKYGEGEHHFWYRGKLRIIKALGTGKQIRGMNVDNMRPQLGICDDIEDNENVNTDTNLATTRTWFYGQFLKAMARFNTPIIHIGNLISDKGLLADHLARDSWISIKYGCLLSNGQPLWPDMWPLSAIRADFHDYMLAGMLSTWFAEMMNMPTGGHTHIVNPDKITYLPSIVEAEDVEYGFITVDPAISDKQTADNCAIVSHGYVSPYWRQLEYWCEKNVTPLEMFQEIINQAFDWRLTYVGVESNAFQSVLIYIFNYWCRKYRYDNFVFVPLYNKNKKLDRIKSWCGMLHAGDTALNSDDTAILDSLLDFRTDRTNNDDDLIDCCSFSVQMIDRHIEDIIEALHPDTAIDYELSKTTVYERCPV